MRPVHPRGAELLQASTYLGDPHPLYATLRREAPITWVEDPGFWALSTHALVTKASLHPEDFCSRRGILVGEIGTTYDFPPTMMHTDAPEHTRYRRLVQPGFKPSMIKQLRTQVEAAATRLLNQLPLGEDVDIVEALSVPFPLQVIAEILGADVDEWPTFFRWSEAAIPDVLELSAEERAATQLEMWNYLIGLAEARRSDPRDDVVSAIATATIDGDLLSETELAMFLIQLLVAGNETTRNLISGGLVALAERPDQWDLVATSEAVLPAAVDEMLRWTTPVTSFLRTATGTTVFGDQTIEEGDPVLLLYASANFDENVFGPTAGSFDVTRSPNPHVSFGVGNHFCLGAALARMEAEVLLRGLRERVSTLHLTGQVERTPSSIISGVRRATLQLNPK
jgi:cytochrome P450